MKRYIFLSMLLALLLPSMAHASNEENLYFKEFANVLESADDVTTGAEKAFYYAIQDLDNDGVKELVIADINKTKTVYKAVNGKVTIISPEYSIDNEKLDWNSIEDFYIYSDMDRSKDVTLRHHPMFAYDISIAKNRFTVPGDVTSDEATMKSTTYDRMVFKPHVGNIHFVNAKNGSYDSDGTKIELGMCYTYALDDASLTKKMFRGYTEDYAVPIIVPAAWLNDHTPLQFSRYLYGEAKPKVAAQVRNIIEQYYGNGYKIYKIEWVATCHDQNRSFYNVTFKSNNGNILLAFVCIANGEVKSVKNHWFEDDKNNPGTTTLGPEIGDLSALMPEIMVMTDTKAGFEIYVRYHSLEGMHYDIWREVADQWLTIQGAYHYIMGY